MGFETLSKATRKLLSEFRASVSEASFWVQLGLVARSSFVRALIMVSAVLLVAYAAAWILVSQLFESLAPKSQIIAIAGSSISQTAFGVPIGLEVGVLDDGTAVDFRFELGVFPTLLVAVFIFFAGWSVRRVTASFEKRMEKFISGLAAIGVTSATVSTLLVVQNFAVNRYAVFPLDSVLPRWSVSSLSLTDLGIVFLLCGIGGMASYFSEIGQSSGKVVNGLNWFSFVMTQFLIWFGIVAAAIGLTVAVEELIDVDFVPVNQGGVLEATWLEVSLALLALVLFLPTLLGNLLWLSFGSSFGVQDNLNSSPVIESVWPLFSNLGDGFASQIFQSWSPWDEVGAWGLIGLIPIILVSLLVGAAGSIRTSFRPASFWSLPLFLAGGILVTLVLWKMTSVTVGFHAELLFGSLDFDDPLFDRLLSDGVQIQSGGTEASAVLAALLVVFCAFLGSKYLSGPLGRIFPRLMSFISGTTKNDGPTERARSSTFIGRALLTAIAAPPVVLLSLAGYENFSAHRYGADEFARELASVFLSGDVEAAKSIFANQENYDWFPDGVLGLSMLPVNTPVDIKLLDRNGGALEVNETESRIRFTFRGEDPFTIELNATALPQAKILGAERYEFEGTINPPIVDLGLPDVLADAGVGLVSVNGEGMQPGAYVALPGTYSFTTEGRGIVSGTESRKLLSSGRFAPDFSPTVTLDRQKSLEMTQQIASIAEECAEVDNYGKSSCFDVSAIEGEPRSLNGNVPTDYYDFAVLNDYAVESSTCDDFQDILLDAFSLKRSINCTWEVDRSHVYYARKVIRTPVYATGTTTSWVRECERVYYWFLDDYEWEGCWRETTYQYQSGTTTSYSRGAKLFQGRFRYELSGEISLTAKLEGSELVFGEPKISINQRN